ncbi:MAG TPA: type II toxin-antitoxin system RelE/ParE family toxin [Nitrososphaera sp.]|jgi:mRNA interferase RelE/StbE|nr:type II toxin-antitoxin system RelE/ParE family toxin [Nitrososphaera sp.]
MIEPYSVFLTRRARKDLDRLDRQTINRLAPQIDTLALNPRPAGCLKVKGEENLWRIRVGDWRIGYNINDAAREIIIIRIGHRREFYD